MAARPPLPSPAARSRGEILLAGAVIVAAGLAAYHNSFGGEFVFDDLPSIVDNATIRHLGNLGAVLNPPGGGFTVSGRPVLNLSLAVNYAISGYDVWSYHALNLLIHLLAGLTLFGVIRRTLDRMRGTGFQPVLGNEHGLEAHAAFLAFAVALLWTVHPLQTESVTYIIQRGESLMGLFYLLTLYGFIRYADESEGGRRQAEGGKAKGDGGSRFPLSAFRFSLLSVTACFLGMATKEVMVSAPLIVLLYDRTFVSGSFRAAWGARRRYYLALAGTWLVLAALVAGSASRGGTAGFGSAISWSTYGITQFRAVAHYLRLALWPDPLVFYYGMVVGGPPADLAIGMVVVLGLAAATVCLLFWPARREEPGVGGEDAGARPAGRDGAKRALGFAGACFFAILAPSSSVVPVATETMAEHRMYLALAPVLLVMVGGIFLAAAALLKPASGRAARLALVCCLVAAVGFVFMTAARNRDYRTRLGLWTVTAAALPDNEFAQYNLGVYLVKAGDRAGGIAHYREAVRLRPDYIEAHTNLGLTLSDSGRWQEAIAEFAEALEINPAYPKAHFDLAVTLGREHRLPEAIAEYEETLRLQPGYPEADLDAGDALADAGRVPEAIAHYEKAMRLEPDNADIHNNLGIVLVRAGRVPEAVAQFRRALQLRPDHAAARKNLAALLARLSAP